ncbi:hypothetical protein [Sphingomonas insulae]|nr:hypothetical protein [Sphingomonas insulae]
MAAASPIRHIRFIIPSSLRNPFAAFHRQSGLASGMLPQIRGKIHDDAEPADDRL